MEQLLVRAAVAQDRLAAEELVLDAGWNAQQCDAWHAGAPAVVLFDPADTAVYGIVVAEPRAPGVFDLVAWAVTPLIDEPAAADRLVRAIADRVRRDGGERLLVTVHDGAAGALLEGCGFQELSRRHDGVGSSGIVVTYYLGL